MRVLYITQTDPKYKSVAQDKHHYVIKKSSQKHNAVAANSHELRSFILFSVNVLGWICTHSNHVKRIKYDIELFNSFYVV